MVGRLRPLRLTTIGQAISMLLSPFDHPQGDEVGKCICSNAIRHLLMPSTDRQWPSSIPTGFFEPTTNDPKETSCTPRK